jgi:hypothetical protein
MLLAGFIPTQVDSEQQFDLGTVAQDYDGKKYKYVKLLNETATVAGASGDVVAYLGSPSATENNTVVTDNTDAATKPVGAGVLQATVTGATGTAEFVWVQVSGPFTANQTLAGTPADGDSVFLSTTDKTLTLSTAADDPVCAQVTDASANKCIANFAY